MEVGCNESVQGIWGQLVGVSCRLTNDTQCICVSVKDLIDELWSEDKQKAAFSHPNMSQHGRLCTVLYVLFFHTYY